MIASIEWGENQTFKRAIFNCQGTEERGPRPRRTSCPLSDYTILKKKKKSNCDYWQKNYLFYRPHLCNFLYYIIYKSRVKCPLFANNPPLFCPPEKNGISRQGKRLRFDFSSARYKYTRSLVSAFCIFIRLRLFIFSPQNRHLFIEKVAIFINRPCFCIIIQCIFMYNVYTAKIVLLY